MANLSTFTQSLSTAASNLVDVPKSIRIVDAVLLLIISFSGLIGNIFIVVAFCFSKKLQTTRNIFVINLAITECLTCILLPVISWSLLIEPENKDLKVIDIICGVTIGAVQIFVGCIVTSLMCIAINRYLWITKQRSFYDKVYRYSHVLVWLFFSWSYPLLVGTIPLYFDIGDLGFDKNFHSCGSKTDHIYSHLYDFIFVGLVVPVPMVIILLCYAKIYLHIRQHNSLMRGLMDGYRGGFLSDQNAVRPIHLDREPLLGRQVISQNQVDITKNLFVIVVTFIVLLIPQLVAESLDARPVVILHTSILVTVNCCINPVLYGLKHPFFRQVFKSIMMCRWEEIPQPAFKFLHPRPLPLNSVYPTEYLNDKEPILQGYRRLST